MCGTLLMKLIGDNGDLELYEDKVVIKRSERINYSTKISDISSRDKQFS